jgi:hypothetical protein
MRHVHAHAPAWPLRSAPFAFAPGIHDPLCRRARPRKSARTRASLTPCGRRSVRHEATRRAGQTHATLMPAHNLTSSLARRRPAKHEEEGTGRGMRLLAPRDPFHHSAAGQPWLPDKARGSSHRGQHTARHTAVRRRAPTTSRGSESSGGAPRLAKPFELLLNPQHNRRSSRRSTSRASGHRSTSRASGHTYANAAFRWH